MTPLQMEHDSKSSLKGEKKEVFILLWEVTITVKLNQKWRSGLVCWCGNLFFPVFAIKIVDMAGRLDLMISLCPL